MTISNPPIRLLVADDHALIKEGFKNLFAFNCEFELVATAANGKEAIEQTQKNQPHVIIMDIKMPVVCGIEACRHIQSHHPAIKVIAFSMFDDEQNLVQMRLAGASGYLLKNSNPEEIYTAIRAVYEGGEYYCSSLRSRINQLFQNGKLGPASNEKKQNYSAIELKIIQLLCEERTSKEIADVLHLSKRTIEHQKEKIQEKMGVQGSIGIVVYALNNWLLC